MIKYKVNVLAALKEKGFSTYKIRKDKILSESTLQKFRNSELVSWKDFNTLCQLLNCQPGDIMEYVPDVAEKPAPDVTENEINDEMFMNAFKRKGNR